MDERFDLQKYLTEGVEQVIKDALRATLKDPRESAFLVKGAHLAPDDADREFMAARIDDLRGSKQDMIYISFPGDEKSSGGCLAAGRGFFHINSHGGAEPCPFSPYSDINVKDTSLREALQSELFTALRSSDILADDHIGGCVLHEKREQVEKLLKCK